MRLIDADELIKDRVENDPVRIAAMCAPTAYDVDKVVERLGESKEIYPICGGMLHVYAVRIDKAINAVKEGFGIPTMAAGQEGGKIEVDQI